MHANYLRTPCDVRIATLAKTINSGNVRPSTPSDVFLLRERIRFPPAQVLLLRHQVTHGEHTKLSNARTRTLRTDVTLAFSRWAAEIGGLRRGLRAMLPDGEI